MDADDLDDKQSLSGTTLASSTFSADTIVPFATPTSPPLEYHFFKGNGLTSKASVRSTASQNYQLVADIHRSKPSHMQLLDVNGVCLGSLEYPATYNSFQIHAQGQLVQARARVGHPHPSSYRFTIPTTLTSAAQTVQWQAFGTPAGAVGYHLHKEGTNVLIASWQLSPREKHQAMLRWHVEPGNEIREVVVLLSFIGALTRLKLKGKDDSERGSQLARWNSMWFMAILGTAAVA